jgi:hypothetical protein
METVLFTDHSVVVFAVITGALALIFSVLGLATTSQKRSDIQRQLKGLQ